MRLSYTKYSLHGGVQKLKTRTALVLSALGLAFSGGSLSLGLFSTAHAQTPCTVGSGSYLTIQDAVNDNSCTTITVEPGTYNESVNVDRAVTIDGPNVGVSGDSSSRSSSAALVQQINITASNVVVDGFSFTNPGTQVNVTSSSILSGVVIKDNIFSGYSSVGLPTYNAGNLQVSNNLFKSPQSSTEAIQISANGDPSAGGCNGTVVNDNVFDAASNNGAADLNLSCTGSDSTGVTVTGNTDTGNIGGTSFVAFSGVTGGIKVSGNTATTSGSSVFFFGSVSGSALIEGNSITNGGSNAVSIHAGDYTSDTANTGTFTIKNNNLSGDVKGIYVAGSGLSSGAKLIANNNNLSGDTGFGIDNLNSAGVVADGICNWWGAPNGPSEVGSGSGSQVSNLVNYSPWLTSQNGACNSTHPTTMNACKNDGWMSLSRDDFSTFKNQGACVSYVASNGKSKH